MTSSSCLSSRVLDLLPPVAALSAEADLQTDIQSLHQCSDEFGEKIRTASEADRAHLARNILARTGHWALSEEARNNLEYCASQSGCEDQESGWVSKATAQANSLLPSLEDKFESLSTAGHTEITGEVQSIISDALSNYFRPDNVRSSISGSEGSAFLGRSKSSESASDDSSIFSSDGSCGSGHTPTSTPRSSEDSFFSETGISGSPSPVSVH